jgi:hypothetical protein
MKAISITMILQAYVLTGKPVYHDIARHLLALGLMLWPNLLADAAR